MKFSHSTTGRSPLAVVKKLQSLPQLIKQLGDQTAREMIAATPTGSIAPNGLLKLAMLNAMEDGTGDPNAPFYGIGRFGANVPGSLGDIEAAAPKGTITAFMLWYRGQVHDQVHVKAYNKQQRAIYRAKKKARQQGGSSTP